MTEALAKSPQDSPAPPATAGCAEGLPGAPASSPSMSTLLLEAGGAAGDVDADAGAGGGASFTPPGGGGKRPRLPGPPLGLGRLMLSWPSFFYHVKYSNSDLINER